MELKNLSLEELQKLAAEIATEIKSRNVVDYLIDDENRFKTRDTVQSYFKVFPAGIVRKEDGFHATTLAALEWANERAEKLGWELIKQ